MSKKKKTRATTATVELRTIALYHLRLNGAAIVDIKAFAKEQKWKVGERQLFNYIRLADDLIDRSVDRNAERAMGRHLAQRRMLFSRCMKIQDYKTALSVLRDEADLLDLYAATKLLVGGDDGAPPIRFHPVEELSDDDLRRIAASGRTP